MKSSIQKIIVSLAITTCLMAGTSSCSKIFDVEPTEVLSSEQMYRNIFDADAAIVGLYGKFMSLAKQHVILNELRADLMDVTANADDQLRQLNNHNVVVGNAYADPKPYYEVILNCNDILKNFKLMLQENKIKAEEYNQRSADVIALRSWIYLQLGIQFGTVPYVTEPVEQVNELANLDTTPKLALENLIKELIKTIEAIPAVYREPYTSTTTLVTVPVDGYPLSKFFINKHILLADLYLWDNQYLKAAHNLSAGDGDGCPDGG